MGKNLHAGDEAPDFSSVFQPPYDELARVGYQEGRAFAHTFPPTRTWQTMKVEPARPKKPPMGKSAMAVNFNLEQANGMRSLEVVNTGKPNPKFRQTTIDDFI